MATTGSFDLNLNALGNTTNNATNVAEKITEELANQADLVGLGIAIAISLTLIFGAVFIALGFIPKLLGSLKGLKKGV